MRTLYHLINRSKNSYNFQFIILCVIFISCLMYTYLFLADIGGYLKVLNNNTVAVKSDKSLVEVTEYSVNKDGSVSFKLSDGTSEESSTVSFIFVKDDDFICSYSVEDNVIISKVSEDLWLNFLSGTNYFSVLGYSFFLVILGYILRKKDFPVLSASYTLWIFMFLFVIISASGIIAYYKLS